MHWYNSAYDKVCSGNPAGGAGAMIDDFGGPGPDRKKVSIDGLQSRPLAKPFSRQAGDEGALPQPIFRTPEQVSGDAQKAFESEQRGNHSYLPGPGHHLELEAGAGAKSKRGLKAFFRKPDLTKKQWIIAGVLAAVLLGGGSVLAYKLIEQTPASSCRRQKSAGSSRKAKAYPVAAQRPAGHDRYTGTPGYRRDDREQPGCPPAVRP
jgi:hypothetical protein